MPGNCLTLGQKIELIVGIARRFGARQGNLNYDPRFDVNHDAAIDLTDLFIVLNTPTCRGSHH